MHRRQFGQTGPRVGEVGLGCWQFGGDWGEVGDDTALGVLRAAVERGVDFFDTADVYGGGRSESLIGRFLRETSSDVFVATKLGRSSGAGFPDGFTWDSFRACTEASLGRLGVGSLDLTQLHCLPTEWLARGEVFDWLRRLRHEGKIRRFGASVESMDEALICLDQEGLASLQIIFNLFRQKPITALFEKAQARGVALIVRLPLASGLLTGKYTKGTQFAPQDHRTYNRNGQAFNVGETFAGLPFEKGVELADALKAFVPEGMTLTQMAMRWILDHPAVTVIIPGAKDPEQAAANAVLSDLPPLPPDLHARLREFYERQVAAHIRGPY
ncbi:MAG: aldo/keto reductase [Armatimonadetes bacterium]|nr:aldo/keto reductase [Armatimonadota bacterium]